MRDKHDFAKQIAEYIIFENIEARILLRNNACEEVRIEKIIDKNSTFVELADALESIEDGTVLFIEE